LTAYSTISYYLIVNIPECTADEAFLAEVLAGRVPPDGFGHGQHVRLAFLLIARYGFSEGADRTYEAIEGLSLRHGHGRKFHATLSTLWPRLVAAHMGRAAEGFGAFVAREHALLDKTLPYRFYSSKRMWSDAARARFVEPDLCDLPRVQHV